jgi:hypothetical protein
MVHSLFLKAPVLKSSNKHNCEALLRRILHDLRESFKVYGAYSSDDNYNNLKK